jgi:hypothetical protein
MKQTIVPNIVFYPDSDAADDQMRAAWINMINGLAKAFYCTVQSDLNQTE